LKKFIWSSVEFLTGILPGFFLVFNFMFTDVTSVYERVFSFLLVAVTYLLLGTAFGLAAYAAGMAGVWLSLPAILFVLIYSFKETDSALINILYAAVALLFSLIGSRLGTKLSKNRKH
jgi:hypothetical protein